jgi:hypothetical protein
LKLVGRSVDGERLMVNAITRWPALAVGSARQLTMRGRAGAAQDRIAGCLLHRLPKLSKRSLVIRSNGTRGYGSADLGSVADHSTVDIARIMGIDLDGGVRISLCGVVT